MLPAVVKDGSDSDCAVAHASERIVIHRDFTLAENLGRGEPALLHGFGHGRRLRPARNKNEDSLGTDVLRALHEGRKVGAGNRHTYRTNDLAARILESFGEPGFGIDPRPVIGHHGIDLADAELVSPLPERVFELRNGERCADDIRRLGGDDGGGCIHDHHEFLCFRRNVARPEGFRCQHEAGQNVDLVAHDKFLCQTLGNVRVRTTGVFADDLDLLSGDGVAVLLDVKLDGIVHLRRSVGELTRIRHDQADLDGLLRVR